MRILDVAGEGCCSVASSSELTSEASQGGKGHFNFNALFILLDLRMTGRCCSDDTLGV